MLRILVLNYGGTSAKLAIYEDTKCVHELSVDYSKEESELSLPAKEDIALKKKKIMEWLRSLNLKVEDIDVFAPRLGGTFYGGDGGTFMVEGALKKHIESGYDPNKPLIHATYGTLQLVDTLQEEVVAERPVLTTDPTSVNQFLPEARITGCPEFTKRASFHALNQRAAARKAATVLGKKYCDVNLIVVHAGGGVSVGAHEKGRIIDVNDSTGDGDGAFSPNRAGSVPGGQLIQMCFSGKYSEAEMLKLLRGKSGLKGYLMTDDLREVEKRMDDGDEKAILIFNAMCYQISREIGACYATLCGEVDAIVITAGLANSHRLVNLISTRVGKIAPLLCFPGSLESEALALGAYRIMTGEEELAVYDPAEEYKNIDAVSAN